MCLAPCALPLRPLLTPFRPASVDTAGVRTVESVCVDDTKVMGWEEGERERGGRDSGVEC